MGRGRREVLSLKKPLVWMGVAAGVCVALFLFWASRRSAAEHESERRARTEAGSPEDQKVQKFHLTGLDENGKEFWVLEGETARIEPGEVIELDRNVMLKLKDTVIRSDHVRWSPARQTLETDTWVSVDQPSTTIRGEGAIARPKEGFVQLNRNVEMVLNGSTRVTCKGPLKIFYRLNRALFYKDVKITDAKGELTAARMEVLFDRETKKVTQVIARGNVVTRRGEDTTRSESATYNVATASVKLEGRPQILLHQEKT